MRLLVLALIAAALIAGCDGSDSADDESPRGAAETAPAARDYVRRVDALCKDANPRLAAIMARVTRARDAARAGQVGLAETLETFAALLTRARDTAERLTAQLRDVEVPAAERAFHDDLVASAQEGAVNLRRQVSAAERRDSLELREHSIRGTVIAAERRGLIAGHGGFRFCGRG